MAAAISPAAPGSLPSLSIRGMSHDRLLIKLREVSEENIKLIRCLQISKRKLELSESQLRVAQRQLIENSLHPALRRQMAEEGKAPRAIVRYP